MDAALSKLLATDRSTTSLAQRVLVGAVMFPHGAQKLLGWFGGYGFSGTLEYFAGLGIPRALGALVILAESLGALALVLGLFSRLSALGVSASIAGALLLVHLEHGFFMNWFGNQQGEGIEFALLMLGLSLPLIVRGGGRLSLDAWLRSQLSARARVLAAQPA